MVVELEDRVLAYHLCRKVAVYPEQSDDDSQ